MKSGFFTSMIVIFAFVWENLLFSCVRILLERPLLKSTELFRVIGSEALDLPGFVDCPVMWKPTTL